MIFAHFIGDVFLRNKIIDKYKSKDPFVMWFHCFIWSACISIVLEIYGLWTPEKFIFLLFGHYIIDRIKSVIDPVKSWEKDNKPDISKFKVIDQLFHFIQLGVVLWI